MPYPEYTNINWAEVAGQILSYWKEKKIFELSVTQREGCPGFTFYEGPPSANGIPGIHHVMARAIKDIFCRYKTLKGFQVKRKSGWDTHGLPVELQVEKKLNITKDDIGNKISVEEYNKHCNEDVMKYTGLWEELTEKMGYWIDLKEPYITCKPDYIETLWHLIKELYQKGLVYKGYSIQPYSPAAGSGLSSHEINLPGCYKLVKDTSCVAQFKLKHKIDEYLLAWTTTPWTLPSNSALAVGKNIDYVTVETFNQYTFQKIIVTLGKDVLNRYFIPAMETVDLSEYKEGNKQIPYRILKSCKGAELEGLEYEQLLPYIKPIGRAFFVICGDFVSTEEGTGIVHIAPTFGADDLRVARQNNIAPVTVTDPAGNIMPLVDKQGKFVKEVTDFASMEVKNYSNADETVPGYKTVDELIVIKLKKENKAFKVERYEHNYPHCWRTDKPILYYPLDSWFIRTTALKERMIELNKTINWKPASTGTGRFGNWLENMVDWNLSRSRFWGTPLPIWKSKDGKEEICIGSFQELREEVKKSVKAGWMKQELSDDFNPHKPWVDEIILVSKDNQPMYRESDLIDVWFDSGAMPFAQWHYPFENEELFQNNFPADFIAEGVDQTRGWFYTLHALAVMLKDKVAFKNVISNGLVLDKDGNKMSKRLGNAVDPYETLAKYGPDPTRWYMISNAAPWENLKFNPDGIEECQRKFFGTLHNTYNFFALYANIDHFENKEPQINLSNRTESDRWILSRLNHLMKDCEKYYEEYEPTPVARAIQDFVINDLSNWYVRLNRKRFWKGEYNEDKIAAFQTLFKCLETVSILASPIAPFYMDRVFMNLQTNSSTFQPFNSSTFQPFNSSTHQPFNSSTFQPFNSSTLSVHLTNFPTPEPSAMDILLEERMTLAQNVSSLVHSLRKKHGLKVRIPLSRLLIPVTDVKLKEQYMKVEELILSEVNIKKTEYIDDTSELILKKVKANFKSLGKRAGPRMKVISGAIASFGKSEVAQLEEKKIIELTLPDGNFDVTPDDVEIFTEDIPGWIVASDNGITVALDLSVTEELKMEGTAREFVNRIQNLRKEKGLDVTDKIRVQLWGNDFINQTCLKFKDYICMEIQALEFLVDENLEDFVELEVDGFKIKVKMVKSLE